MSDFPTSGVKIVADLSEYTQRMEDAVFIADYLDSLSPITIAVAADVDTGSFEIPDLPTEDETVSITYDATLTGDELPIDDETIDVNYDATLTGDELPADDETIDVNYDATLGGDELPTEGETIDVNYDATLGGDELPTDDQKIAITADVTETDTSKAILADLHSLTTMQALSFVWNVTGNILDVLGGIEKFTVEPLLAVDDAVAKINAQTASAIPGVKEIVEGIHSDDLSDSYDVIAKTVIQAQQLGAPVREAASAALEFTKVFTDQDPTTVLNTMQTMVKQGLAPGFKEAGDMLVTAFQGGANRSGDLLTAINSNAVALKDMGYDGTTAIGLIKQGLDGGYKSANDVAQSIVKIKQNATTAAGNESSDFTKTLNMLGIANPADTGEAWSKDFLASVITGIQNSPASDSQKQAMLSAILGGKLGAKDFSSFMSLDPASAAQMFAPMKGASHDAATEIDNSLHGAINDFELAAQTAATNFLSSSQIDLPGKISALKLGLQDGLAALQSGGSLSDALTIALKPIGFDDEFAGLQSMLGNFVIALLQVVSAMQSLSPGSWDAKKGTDALIVKQSTTQLSYDLKIANPDDVATDIATATSRGLTQGQVAEAVSNTISELIKTGTADSLTQAQTLIDTLKKPVDQNTLPTLASGAPMNVEPTVTPEAIQALQDKLNAAQPVTVTIKPTADDAWMDGLKDKVTGATGPMDGLNTKIDTAGTNATEAAPAIATVANSTKTQGDNSAAAVTPTNNMGAATKKSGDAAKTAVQPVSDYNAQLSVTAQVGPLAAAGLGALNDVLQGLMDKAKKLVADATGADTTGTGTADGSTAVTGHASGTGSAIGTFMVGEAGPEIMSSNTSLAVLNNMTTQAIVAAMQSYIPGGNGAGSGKGNTYIANNTNIVQSEAQADSVGYATAKQLRGMS